MRDFASYLQLHLDAHGWTKAHFARKAGLDASLVGRWLAGGNQPSVDGARKIAASIGRPLLEVLVAAGYLTAEEAHQRPPAPIDLATVPDDQLLGEVRRRMNRRP